MSKDNYLIFPQWMIDVGLEDKSIVEKDGKLYHRGYVVMCTDELTKLPPLYKPKKQNYRDLEYKHVKKKSIT